MKTFGILVVLLLASPAAYATPVADDKKATEEPSERPCLAHFAKEGNLFKGYTLSSWQEFTGLEYDAAFRKVAQATAQLGWVNLAVTKDAGTITAGQSGGSISVVVNEGAGGVLRVDAKISLGGDNPYPDKNAKKALCASVEAPGL